MFSQHSFRVEGRFHLPDDESDDGEFYRLNAKLWSHLPAAITARAYSKDDIEATIFADWNAAVELTGLAHEVLQKSVSGQKVTGVFRWAGDYPSEISVPVTVQISKLDNVLASNNLAAHFVENYLCDVFMMLNLALPGSADFMNLSVVHETEDRSSRLRLASFYPFEAYISEEWPPVRELNITTVERWYSTIRLGATQVPNSPLERAIFAIMHVCCSSGRPEDIIWLFYAFESLLQTRVGENFAGLVDRLERILGPDKNESAKMKKQLRKMYDYRSSFVHGGLNVIHPLHNEMLDRRVDQCYTPIIEMTEYGLRLLFACMQTYISKNWKGLRFDTVATPLI